MSVPAVIVLPTIHTNGTSPEMLCDGYVDAMLACGAAIEKAQKIEFNARDYYVSPMPQAWELAREQFTYHLKAIKAAQDYFEAIASHCEEARVAREERRNKI